MKTIFIVGFETSEKGCISFWDWYVSKEEQQSRIDELKNHKDLKGILYYGEFNIPELEVIDTNNYIELLLEENNWENTFPDNKIFLPVN